MQRKNLLTLPSDVQSHMLSFLNYGNQRQVALSCKNLFAEANKTLLHKQIQEYKNKVGSYPAFAEDLKDQIQMEALITQKSSAGYLSREVKEICILLDTYRFKKWILYYLGLMDLPENMRFSIANPTVFTSIEFDSAADYFSQGLEAGDHKAAYQLCRLIHLSESSLNRDHFSVDNHYNVTPILEKALKENEYLEALTGLAFAYLHGIGVKTDYEQAEHYAERTLLENSDDTAVLEIAKYYLNRCRDLASGISVPDPIKFLERMFDINPTVLIAMFLGDSMDDARLTRKWYLYAYSLGSVDAAVKLGDYYAGVAMDLKKAIRWYERAFLRGKADMVNTIVRCIEDLNEFTEEQRESLSKKWLVKGAKAGNFEALNSLRQKECDEVYEAWWMLLPMLFDSEEQAQFLRDFKHNDSEFTSLVLIISHELGLFQFALPEEFLKKNSLSAEIINKFRAVGEQEELLIINTFNIGEALNKLQVQECQNSNRSRPGSKS